MNMIRSRTKKLERKIVELAREPEPYIDYDYDYDYDKLTTEELEELAYGLDSGTITEERFNEILEPVKFINRDPSSLKMRFDRMLDEEPEELEEQIQRYRRINKE